ncbi:biotin carboxylase N-terminal domain-containing protein [Propioniciclava soli]|uniref:Biotin carboxylase N-terminal domain-containing protein n=1 Tax=Propioniciclava soli TaxID=2775081 RepID=A0ABZ3C452_9ACTN
MGISKVLVANRGEIAVRIIRAARDAGLASVAVHADPDADALFVRLADDAFALGGDTPAASYLRIDAILDAARRSGSDAVHPGYGFLAENADFARAVTAAGLTWIGPPAEAIGALGDKVRARHIAQRVGAPLVAGTAEPVPDADAAVTFAREHGLPIAIKAAHGGGGRGLKVARRLDEVAAMFDAATRESTVAFGRGECFVEQYLDRPRHVETQCLADAHGHVVVVSTRDCSLQRRHQKLVEEAPAPFLSDAQVATLHDASKAILREAGYVGAGTCEFLVATDGRISFLEVNTRLQVEHPVSEEVTGLDLVREMFRIADGEELGYDDPEVRGHAIEFRINAEDPARSFVPMPGTLTLWNPPTGPGVRVDEGYHAGMTVPGAFDSLVAKIIVTGADRPHALARARRALAETSLAGMPTVLPFHRAVVDDPAFTGVDGTLGVHTRWIETEFATPLEPQDAPAEVPPPPEKVTIAVEVDGRRVEVRVPASLTRAATAGSLARPPRPERAGARAAAPAATVSTGPVLVAPMQGTIVTVAVTEGDTVAEGDTVVVLEAMKMEQPVGAHRAGVVRSLTAEPGRIVAGGASLCEIVDPA